jgi:hypothetical protein
LIWWELCPLNAKNNVNGLGGCDKHEVFTLDKHGGLLAVQEAMVRRIVTELRDFDNVYYEVCNEPYWSKITPQWQHHIVDLIVDTEKDFPDKHLIPLNVFHRRGKVTNPHPSVSILNFHYAWPPAAVALNYDLDRVIGDDETGFTVYGDGRTEDEMYRREGWSFILAGGGLYSNLDYSFAVGYEDGTFQLPRKQWGGGSIALRKQLRVLKEFIHSFDFIRMKPDQRFVKSGVPNEGVVYVLSEKGKEYALREATH